MSNSNTSGKKTGEKQPDQEANSISDINKIKFDKDEMNLLSSAGKELGIDNENFTDLKNLPKVPDMSDERINKVLSDSETRTLIKEVGEDPNITETMREGEEIGRLSSKDFKEIADQVNTERQNLIMWLGSQPRIRLHVKAGEKNNKTVWVEKEFPYRSLDKRQELNVALLRARLQAIQIKHNILGNKQLNTLNDEEKSFLDLSQFMIEIAGYRVAEYEARLRFGMTSEDFARIDSNEFNLASQAYIWRVINVPYYRAKQ